MEHRQMVIIGAGAAGLTAAIYGRRSGLDTLVLEPGMFGGQINNTSDVENYPGMKRTEGMALARAFREHAEMFAPEFRECRVESISLGGGRYDKVVVTDKGEIAADVVIIASGATFTRIGCRGEDEFAGRGVSYCAVCDGPFYEGLPVVVVGGGNTAVEEADYLTQFASRIYIVHRREELRADRVIVDRAEANPKIEFVLGYVVEEIAGGDMVERVELRSLKTGDRRTIEAEGVFVFVGTKPEVDFLADCKEIKRSSKGWIITDDKMETSVEGIFAAGDVRDKFLRQVVTATSDGATAAMAAFEYVSNQYYLESSLFGGDSANALFISSILPEHLALADEIEALGRANQRRPVVIDAHRNARMAGKLVESGLPALVKISGGSKVRESHISSLDDFISEVDAP